MTPLIRRSVAALASTTLLTFALATVLPPSAAQDAGTTKSQSTKKKSASKAKTSSKKAEEEAAAEDAPEAKPKAKGGRQAPPDAEHRVPPYFGALNLTPEQKEAIYKIQGKYLPQIQELEKQAEALREKRSSEFEGVLTASQKKALTEARKAAADRREAAAARRKAADKAKTED